MGPKIPEIKYIHPPYRIEGSPKEARTNFYDFAKKRVKYLSEAEIRKWDTERGGDPESKRPRSALYIISTGGGHDKEGNLEKWVNNLEIVVNKDAFKIKGRDYTDIMLIEKHFYWPKNRAWAINYWNGLT